MFQDNQAIRTQKICQPGGQVGDDGPCLLIRRVEKDKIIGTSSAQQITDNTPNIPRYHPDVSIQMGFCQIGLDCLKAVTRLFDQDNIRRAARCGLQPNLSGAGKQVEKTLCRQSRRENGKQGFLDPIRCWPGLSAGRRSQVRAACRS